MTTKPQSQLPWSTLTARDVMRTEVMTVSTTTPLSELERLLGEHRVSGLPVTDETGHLVGVVSMRDLIEHYAENPNVRPRRGFFHEASAELDDDESIEVEVPDESDDTVADVMTGEVFAVAADATLAEVATEMVARKVHRLLVRENGKHVGLISTFDVLSVLASQPS